jgi:DNA-binding transcriptional LysR family regulator
MELRHIRYFVAVAEAGSFRKAAENLHIAQPALTRQISALEQHLGVQLFERGSRRRALGPAGRAFLEDAHDILQAVEASKRHVRTIAGKDRTKLRVSFTEVVSNFAKFKSFIEHLRTAMPCASIEMLPMSSFQQIGALLNGLADVGCLYCLPNMDSTISVHPLEDDPVVAVLRADHVLARRSTLRLGDLQNEHLICVSRAVFGEIYRSIIQSFRGAALRVPTISEEENSARVTSLVSVGMGIGLLTLSIAKSKLPSGSTFRPIEDFNVTCRLALAWRAAQSDSAVATLCRAFC